MIISERIFQRLDELNMTQKEFAMKTGITPSTISDWKRKKTNPAADKLLIICKALSMTPNELLSDTSDTDERWKVDYMLIDNKTEEYLLLEQYHSLDGNQKARLLGYMQALMQAQAEHSKKET